MDVELVRLIGSGMLLIGCGLKARVPDGALNEGMALIARLSEKPDTSLKPLIERCARGLWKELANAHRSDDDRLRHVMALPGILDTCRPSPDAIIGLIAEMQMARRRGQDIQEIAQRHATTIMARARGLGLLSTSRLAEALCVSLVAALLTELLADDTLATRLRLGLTEFCASLAARASPDPVSTPDTWTSAHPLHEAIATAVRQKYSPGPAFERQLDDRLALADILNQHLAEAIDDADHRLRRSLLRLANEAVARGQLLAAEDHLANAEAMHATAANGVPPEDRNRHAIATASLRELRAIIMEICGDWRKAARHHAVAAQLLPQDLRLERWRHLMSEARSLVQLGRENDDINALFEAAQVHAQAGSLLSERDSPEEWAKANLELGNLLLLLGEREGRPERFLAAALHFKPAAEAFSDLQLDEYWALAHLGLAHALRGQGEFQGDVVTLEEAIFAYRAALGVLTRDRAPIEWAEAQGSLGMALVRTGEEAGDNSCFEEAIPLLKSAIAIAEPAGAAGGTGLLDAALGRAYLGLAGARDDTEMLEISVEMLRRAVKNCSRDTCRSRIASTQRALGTALWALAEPGTGGDRLEEAIAAKQAALAHYENIGDEVTAEKVAEEIEALRRLVGDAATAKTAAAG